MCSHHRFSPLFYTIFFLHKAFFCVILILQFVTNIFHFPYKNIFYKSTSHFCKMCCVFSFFIQKKKNRTYRNVRFFFVFLLLRFRRCLTRNGLSDASHEKFHFVPAEPCTLPDAAHFIILGTFPFSFSCCDNKQTRNLFCALSLSDIPQSGLR